MPKFSKRQKNPCQSSLNAKKFPPKFSKRHNSRQNSLNVKKFPPKFSKRQKATAKKLLNCFWTSKTSFQRIQSKNNWNGTFFFRLRVNSSLYQDHRPIEAQSKPNLSLCCILIPKMEMTAIKPALTDSNQQMSVCNVTLSLHIVSLFDCIA